MGALEPLVMPEVRIDYTTTARLHHSSVGTEYVLPCDDDWEFPRER